MELKNKIWLNDNGEPIQWLNNKEGKIIGKYLKFIEDNNTNKFQKLSFKDGSILKVEFLGYGEADNGLDFDNKRYQEFYEFYFKIERVIKNNKSKDYKKGEQVYFYYKNFPHKWEIVKTK